MMRITRAEIIAVTLLIHQSPDRSARCFEFCNQAVSLARTDPHNQRPAVRPRYCCNGRLPDGYPPRSIIGKAPHRQSAAMPQRPDFSEKVFQGQAAYPVGIHQRERSW